MKNRIIATVAAGVLPVAGWAAVQDDAQIVAELDRQYQAAVKRNDADAMGRILHEDFILVLGDGRTFTREDLIAEARSGSFEYERQDEDAGTQTVRVFGDTAIVTARLHVKGVYDGRAFDRRLWFSDTYVRTPDGWRYALGQASLPLPRDDPAAGRIVEIRSYNLKPGTREQFHRLFVDEALPLLERAGIDVVGYGPSTHDESSWFLMRAYQDARDRRESEAAFYGSDEWQRGPREAILERIESYTTVVVPMDGATIEGLRKLE